MFTAKEKQVSLKPRSLLKTFRSRQVNILIKLIVAVLLALVIYRQIILRDNIEELWWAFLQNLQSGHLPFLLFAFLLMPLNWALETMKWSLLIRRFEPLGFWKAFQAVFAGITFAIFTPNRIGEYGGRILFVRSKNNWKAVIATIVGSLSQLLVLLSLGLVGLLYFAYQYLELEVYVMRSTIFLGLLSIAILLFCFFNVDLVVPFVKRLPFLKKWKRLVKGVRVLKNYTSEELSKALGFAFLRYIVYSLQYYLLLQFFGIEVGLWAALAGIATIYLIQTSLPVMPLLGLFARVEIALFIWGIFSDNDISILASTFGLWIINLILPALIGTVFIANVNVLKSLGYDTKDS